jgi:hypothetical protein
MMSKLEEEFGKFEGFEYRTRKPLNKLVEGIGINDAPFVVAPTIINKRVTHPAYSTWKNMLNRCYNSKFKDSRPSYIGVTCCDEWLLFTNFAKWFKDNYIEGYHLDKDLLVKDNMIYAPDTCIFCPPEINTFIILSGSIRGDHPLGVSSHREKFQAKIRKDGVMKHLGYFNTKEEAHREWQKAKLEQAIAFNFHPLQRVIDQLTFEIENNLETLSL